MKQAAAVTSKKSAGLLCRWGRVLCRWGGLLCRWGCLLCRWGGVLCRWGRVLCRWCGVLCRWGVTIKKSAGLVCHEFIQDIHLLVNMFAFWQAHFVGSQSLVIHRNGTCFPMPPPLVPSMASKDRKPGGVGGGLEYLGEGLEYLGEGAWSTWERGVGVPGRGGLE